MRLGPLPSSKLGYQQRIRCLLDRFPARAFVRRGFRATVAVVVHRVTFLGSSARIVARKRTIYGCVYMYVSLDVLVSCWPSVFKRGVARQQCCKVLCGRASEKHALKVRVVLIFMYVCEIPSSGCAALQVTRTQRGFARSNKNVVVLLV
jgi:hypothetical protein